MRSGIKSSAIEQYKMLEWSVSESRRRVRGNLRYTGRVCCMLEQAKGA